MPVFLSFSPQLKMFEVTTTKKHNAQREKKREIPHVRKAKKLKEHENTSAYIRIIVNMRRHCDSLSVAPFLSRSCCLSYLFVRCVYRFVLHVHTFARHSSLYIPTLLLRHPIFNILGRFQECCLLLKLIPNEVRQDSVNFIWC